MNKHFSAPLVLMITLLLLCCHSSAAGEENHGLCYAGSCLWNTVRDMKSRDNLLFCAFVNGLEIVDVTSPSEPAIVSTTPLEGGAMNIALEGDIAFISTEKGRIMVLNIRDPHKPFIVDTIYEKKAFITSTEGLLYCACGRKGLKIFSIASPLRPPLVSVYQPRDYSVDRVKVRGTTMYLTMTKGKNYHAVAILDISDPRRIVEITRYTLASDTRKDIRAEDDAGEIYDMEAHDRILYLAERKQGIRMVDLSTPGCPAKETFLPLPESTMAYRLMYAKGNLLVKSTSGLHLYDMTDPEKPRLISQVSNTGGEAVHVEGDYIFMASQWEGGGVTMFTVKNPLKPEELGTLQAPSGIKKVILSENLAYVAHDYGFSIVNVKEPARPHLIGDYQACGYVTDLCISHGRAYVVTSEGGLAITDVSRPARIQSLGGYSEENSLVERVAVTGNYACLEIIEFTPLPGGEKKLGDTFMERLYVGDPSRPRLLGRTKMPGNFTSLMMKGDILYGHWPFGGIYSFMPGNDRKMHLAGSYLQSHKDTCGFGSDERMCCSGNNLYIAHGDCGLTILDISDPSHLALKHTVVSSHYLVDVHACDTLTCLAELDEGIEMLDLSDMAHPAARGRYTTPGCALSVLVEGRYVYCADSSSFLVLRRE